MDRPSQPLSSSLEQAQRADRLVDRRAWAAVGLLMLAVVGVEIMSDISDIERAGGQANLARMLVLELTSIGVLVALFPFVVWFSKVFPLNLMDGVDRMRGLGVYAMGAIAFSLIHVGGFVVLRKILFPLLLAEPYIFVSSVSLLPTELFYEGRKDLLTYLFFLGTIAFSRRLQELQQEIDSARAEARASHRVSLRCGGRLFLLRADRILWVKAAGNYVEVSEGERVHLARATLKSVRDQLREAGFEMVQTHRSWLVNPTHVREISTTGHDRQYVQLTDGTRAPLSRSLRQSVEKRLS